MTFGERVKRLRESINPKIYQKELADAIGVSRQAITMWETGQRIPDTTTLERLADYFGVTTDYLLCRTDHELGTLGANAEKDNENRVASMFQAKTLADALLRLAELDIEYNFDDDTMFKLVRKAREKYGLPKAKGADPAAHGPKNPGSGVFGKKGDTGGDDK
ncbi:MAG: helix-turn-helix transcriptional regulator [Desulfotomaculaceae bacterium]|nr:helix-turn-helix transcriptional regulator [Desulfotomaculaceae bacterium]